METTALIGQMDFRTTLLKLDRFVNSQEFITCRTGFTPTQGLEASSLGKVT
jgi:hypothetical protein